MRSSRTRQRCVGVAIALGCLFGPAAPAFSQIFLPPKGVGSVTTVVQQGLIIYHLIPDEEVERGSIRWNTVFVDFTYGLSDKFAMSVTLPWVRSVYRGEFPHCQDPEVTTPQDCPKGSLGLDDQAYHGAIQDIRAAVLYALKKHGMAITPFVGAIIPSHDYAYFNHSAPGRRLFEVEAGAGIARVLDPVVPDAYVQARYAFGRPQRVLDLSHNRSSLSVEAGYVIKRSLQVFARADGQYTHGGLDSEAKPRCGFKEWEKWSHHDQIGREHYLQVGIGAAYPVTDSLGVFASVVRAVAGHNGHEIDYLWSVGASKTIGKAVPPRTSTAGGQ